MLTLGIETSCDETAAAIVKDGKTVLSSQVSSSVDLHSKFGGIIPEIASRFHLEYIMPVTNQALKKANVKLSDIDLIAVTSAPGLVGSLLVGVSFAKTLSFALKKPLIGVNHINSHLFASFLQADKKSNKHIADFKFPFMGLVVSGGHTSLAYIKDFDKIKFIGNTRDDAAGEAFDKVAKILELGYPGGPAIDNLSQSVKDSPFKFNCAQLKNTFDFSFSGIKTEVLYTTQKLQKKNHHSPLTTHYSPKEKAQIAFSFQNAVVETIVNKSIAACKKFKVNTLCVGGGVACNSLLRQKLKEAGLRENIEILLSPTAFCIDNAAMIAVLGANLHKKGYSSNLRLTPKATKKIRRQKPTNRSPKKTEKQKKSKT